MNNRQKPEFITFTGVDDHTDPAGLVELSKVYPIEWGVLFSPKRQGIEPRYPKMSTIHQLVEDLPLRWSAHLCGADARAVIEGGTSPHDELLRKHFARSQINTTDPDIQPSLIGDWAARRNLRAILQCRGEFPTVASVDVLFDASGGRGIVPSDWPTAVNTTLCGYAGGLRPDNVAQAVEVIGRRATRYFIDMESGVRDDSDRFSLEKCRAVCEAVYGVACTQGPSIERLAESIRVDAEGALASTDHRHICTSLTMIAENALAITAAALGGALPQGAQKR